MPGASLECILGLSVAGMLGAVSVAAVYPLENRLPYIDHFPSDSRVWVWPGAASILQRKDIVLWRR